MKNIFTIFKTILFLSFFLNAPQLIAQDDVILSCPSDVCGSDDDFGATDGIYSESGMSENGQPVYEGPMGNVQYRIKCVGAPAGPFFVYRWEIHNLNDELVYFNSHIVLNTAFPFSTIEDEGAENNWTSENTDYDPAPEMGAILPVELSYFKATQAGKRVQLHWQTATEINNEGFEVQRSPDNRNWEVLDFVVGEGTVYEVQNYGFIDKKPASGVNYYRLKQIDFDGRFVYSTVLSQKLNAGSLKIYPNPVNGQEVSLDFSAIDYADAQVEIFDNLGRVVQRSVLSYGEKQLSISNLPTGFYTVSVKVGGQFLQERLFKK